MCSCPDECSPVNFFLSLSFLIFDTFSLSDSIPFYFFLLLLLDPIFLPFCHSRQERKRKEGRESNKKSVFCSPLFLIQSTPSIIFLPLPFHYSLSLLPFSFVTLPQLLLSDPTIDGRNCEEKSHEYPFQFSDETLFHCLSLSFSFCIIFSSHSNI